MIVSNLSRNASTMSGWMSKRKQKVKRGAGSQNLDEFLTFFPFWPDSEWGVFYQKDRKTGKVVSQFDKVKQIIQDLNDEKIIQYTPTNPLRDDTYVLTYSRWLWMLQQPEQYALMPVAKKKWANVRGREEAETLLIMQSRYVNINVLIYEASVPKFGEKYPKEKTIDTTNGKLVRVVDRNPKRAYINSVLVNPVLKGKGLGTVCIKALENYLIQVHNVEEFFLIPLTDRGDEGPYDITPYWEKMGYAYITNADPKRLARLTIPIASEVDTKKEKPERSQVAFWKDTPSGREKRYMWSDQSVHMWKTAKVWQDNLFTTNVDFNEAIDFQRLLKKNGTDGKTGNFFELDESHETLMGLTDFGKEVINDDFLKTAARAVFTNILPSSNVIMDLTNSSDEGTPLPFSPTSSDISDVSIVELQQTAIESSKKQPPTTTSKGKKRTLPVQSSHDAVNETLFKRMPDFQGSFNVQPKKQPRAFN